MKSYNNSLRSSDSSYNQHSHLLQTHETLFESRQYQSRGHIYHDYHHKTRQISITMNSSDSSSSNHSVSNDYKQCSIRYCPQSSLDYSNEQMISINISRDNPRFRPQSSARHSESSSSGVEIIDDESTEEHSPNYQYSNYRPESPTSSESRSRSPFSRRVIIRSNDQVVTHSKRQRRRHPRRHPRPRQQQKQFMYEKNLMYKKRSSVLSSKHKRPSRSTDRWEHKEEKLQRLFDEYSNENIHNEWNPLTQRDYQELYQYAMDKYKEKSRHN